MKSMIFGAIFLLMGIYTYGQATYKLYSKNGKEVTMDKMVKSLSKSDVVLFGELHNNPICHWMQLKVTQALYDKNEKLTLGAEMFESDNQLLIDEYFNGYIRRKDFEKEMRLWDNYKTDYKPLLEFAFEHNLNFVATNIPRRYAALVNRRGFIVLDSLSDVSKSYMMPLPMVFDTANPSAQKMLQMDFGHGKGGPKVESMVKAQSVKDATMAHFILENLEKKTTFIHFQGDFHSSNYGGIYWYLKYWKSSLDVMTISTIESSDGMDFKEEYGDLGDYVLVITEDMTKTY
jgi:uncharacterized iron-regulated protein